jgi:hypothetical protein
LHLTNTSAGRIVTKLEPEFHERVRVLKEVDKDKLQKATPLPWLLGTTQRITQNIPQKNAKPFAFK